MGKGAIGEVPYALRGPGEATGHPLTYAGRPYTRQSTEASVCVYVRLCVKREERDRNTCGACLFLCSASCSNTEVTAGTLPLAATSSTRERGVAVKKGLTWLRRREEGRHLTDAFGHSEEGDTSHVGVVGCLVRLTGGVVWAGGRECWSVQGGGVMCKPDLTVETKCSYKRHSTCIS